MKANQAYYAVATMCRVLEVSTSGYYAWLKRDSSSRSFEDAKLTSRIERIHKDSDGTYGVPRVQAELAAQGTKVGRKRVARLMKRVGLEGVSRRKKVCTTRRDPEREVVADLVDRDFTAARPNQLWVADITYIPTWIGVLYLAVVLDVFSRRIVGWSMRGHMRTELVQEALDMAIWNRRPVEVIHHSDHGSQYTSLQFGKRCRQAGITLSMGSVGDCFDNAMCESFFASLECELIDRRVFHDRHEARRAVFEYIEGWYNPRRRHSAIGHQSPMDFEVAFASDCAEEPAA